MTSRVDIEGTLLSLIVGTVKSWSGSVFWDAQKGSSVKSSIQAFPIAFKKERERGREGEKGKKRGIF